ncbi:MAG: hypothetical protein WDM77_20005 [Steroidobacteraceae bacterium]
MQHTREMRERQRIDLTKAREQLAELAALIERDEQQVETLRTELHTLEPQASEATRLEQLAAANQSQSEAELGEWQQRWDPVHGAPWRARTRLPRLNAPV